GAAAACVIAHHEVLRMRLGQSAGRWAQRLEPHAGPPPVEEHELGALGEEERRAAVLGAASKLQHGLSVVRGPVLALALCRMGGAAPDALVIGLHHSVYDAYSLDVLVE